MKVQTDLKSGALLQQAASQVGAVAGQTGKFVSQANSQANAVAGYMTSKAQGLWTALVG